jgi:hypothetical protein
MKWDRTAVSEWGCIVSGFVAIGTAVVWVFRSGLSWFPVVAVFAAIVCAILFYLGKRGEYLPKSDPTVPPVTDVKSDLGQWCEALAHNDISNMQQRVIAVSWEPRRVNERSNYYIEFKITFVNASIFELKSPRLGGIAKFDRHPLPFTPQFGQPFPLTRGQKTWMSIRQPLTKEIAEDIQGRLNRDGVTVDLDFSDLEIIFDVEFPGRPTWQWTWKGRDSVSVKAVTF